jgi:2-(1,2-epoxy-1,2-dihydrophenyl)acetyl-CoA isomerase
MSVLVADHGLVKVVTLNRPEVRNAVDLPMRIALAEALEALGPETRAVVLTGAGGAFCAGGDVATMRRQPPEESLPRAEAAARVVRAIWNLPMPVIAAVEGPAYGAGVALALACDRVVSASDARYAATFTRVGLAGDMGIFASLPARVGPAKARQLLMFPTPITGVEAGEIGLVDVVVAPGEALEAALTDARELAEGPPLALGVIKAMLAGPRLDVLAREVAHQVVLFDTDDFAEGVAAFGERRAPKFPGPSTETTS